MRGPGGVEAMKGKRFSYTALGLVFGTAAGLLLAVLLVGAWWYGLVGTVAGLVLGAGLDTNFGVKRRT